MSDRVPVPIGSHNGKCGGKRGLMKATFATLTLSLIAAPAHAQNGEKRDSVGEDALDAMTQPLSDLNLRSRDIPTVLLRAQALPYDTYGLDECDRLLDHIDRLEAVLGPDADESDDKDGLINKGLKAGGNFLGGFIPFRGVIRQVSGAAAKEGEWDRAVFAGVARRSFLKGYAKGLSCRSMRRFATDTVPEATSGSPVRVTDPENDR